METLDYGIIMGDGNVGRQNQRVAIWAYGLSKCSHLAMFPMMPTGLTRTVLFPWKIAFTSRKGVPDTDELRGDGKYGVLKALYRPYAQRPI